MKIIWLVILLFIPLAVKAAAPTVTINEIAWMGTINSSNDEWLDLSNQTENDIDLSGWKLNADDGTPSIELSGVIPAHGYFLLERTDDDTLPNLTADQIYSGSLGNTGEWLKLINKDENIIDELNATNGWPGGDNTTKQTLVRQDNDRWSTSDYPGGNPKNTKDAKNNNPATELKKINPEEVVVGAKRDDILITEIYPNPPGPDSDTEFIELKNAAKADLDLTGWKLTNGAKQNFILPSLTMSPGSIVVFYRQQTKLALNNRKDTITLYSPSNRIINQVSYSHNARETESYQFDSADYRWADPTPKTIATTTASTPPHAVAYGPTEAVINEIIMFDGSDSTDLQNRPIALDWQFGDGQSRSGELVRHQYQTAGKYQVVLTAKTNDQQTSSTTLTINITDPNSFAATTTATSTTEEIKQNDSEINLTSTAEIIISEYLPNPLGSDTDNEFIELYNDGSMPINLDGWQLDDDITGSQPFFIHDTVIEPNQYRAFFRTETKIALNNDGDSVRLFSPNGNIVDESDYQRSKEGQSFIKNEYGDWESTTTPTPGELNTGGSEIPESTSTASTSGEILGDEISVLPTATQKPFIKYLLLGGLLAVILALVVTVKYKGLI